MGVCSAALQGVHLWFNDRYVWHLSMKQNPEMEATKACAL